MLTKENVDVAIAILERADKLGLILNDRTSLHMDLESADVDYDRLASFPDFDFAHDILGVQRHMDRSSYPGKLTDCFLPRSANRH